MIKHTKKLLVPLLAVTFSLNACQEQNPLMIYGLFDRSKSGIENKHFFSHTEKACHDVADVTQYGDQALFMGLDARPPLFVDTSLVQDPDDLHRSCNDIFDNTVDMPGTATCPYLKNLDYTLNRPQNKGYKPFIFAAIHTNEGENKETFCTDTLTKIVETVEKRGGNFIIGSWSDQTGYNHLLQDLLGNYSGVTFCPNPDCVLEKLQLLRTSTQEEII